MRILVTGGGGFIGRQIVRSLYHRGHTVIAPARTASNFFDQRARVALLKRAEADAVIHAAWYVVHGTFWHAPENSAWAEHSMRFIDEVQAAGIRRFIGIGTCYEYAWPHAAACHEMTTPTAVHTPYDHAKAIVRDHLAACADAQSFSTAWARIFLLYGEGEGRQRLGPSVARALLRGEYAACASGRPIRDFLDVRDAGAAIAALACSEVRGAVNIASGEPLSIADFARAVGEELGCAHRIRLGALPDRADEPPYIVADSRRLREEVGFQPAIALRAGIAALCRDQRSS